MRWWSEKYKWKKGAYMEHCVEYPFTGKFPVASKPFQSLTL